MNDSRQYLRNSHNQSRKDRGHFGFSLAELLIAIAIIGLIAAFTIPKVVGNNNKTQEYNAKANEMAYAILAAYEAHKAKTGAVPSASTTFATFTPYLNYVTVKTSGLIVDNVQTGTTDTCSNLYPCLKLHNGATLLYSRDEAFGGTAITNAIWVHFDPDGQYSGSTTGQGKAVSFFLYSDGKIRKEGSLISNTASADSPYPATPAFDPPWFSWQ